MQHSCIDTVARSSTGACSCKHRKRQEEEDVEAVSSRVYELLCGYPEGMNLFCILGMTPISLQMLQCSVAVA